jgi:hypothetical protein
MEQTVEVRWSNKTKKHFESKGYKFTYNGDQLLVSIAELTKNSHAIIKYTCDCCGAVAKTTYHVYRKRIGIDKCSSCFTNKAYEKQKNSFKTIEEAFNDRGYILLSDASDYKNSYSKLRYVCDIHGEQSINYSNFKKGQGCHGCANDNKRGSKSKQWKGGSSGLTWYLRSLLSSWTLQQLQRTDYTCELTGKQGQLNVHHMYSFKNIFEETMSELQLDIRPNVGDYSEDELQLITVNFLQNNNLKANPIVLLESVHQEFHAFCGGNQVDTTMEQLGEFKELLKEAV